MKHLNLVVEDIMQQNLFYYDEESIHACINICKRLNIDYLPSLDGDNIYVLFDEKFNQFRLSDNPKLTIDPHQRLFAHNIKDKFRHVNNNVLFVRNGELLEGVVHVSDYNSDIVLQAIQDDILHFERKLRYFLILNGKRNHDFREYYLYRLSAQNITAETIAHFQNQLKTYDRNSREFFKIGEFQSFSLKDLLEFLASPLAPNLKVHRMSELVQWKNSICRLRNMVMHSKDPIERVDHENHEEIVIWSLESMIALSQDLAILRDASLCISESIRSNHSHIELLKQKNKHRIEQLSKAETYMLGFVMGRGYE